MPDLRYAIMVRKGGFVDRYLSAAADPAKPRATVTNYTGNDGHGRAGSCLGWSESPIRFFDTKAEAEGVAAVWRNADPGGEFFVIREKAFLGWEMPD